MKKSLKAISMILSSTLVMSAFATATAFAAENDAIEKRELTAYLFNMDDTTKLDCMFTSSLPDIPYIELSDYVGVIYNDQFTETKNDDGTFTLTGPGGNMFINPQNDTVSYDSFEKFMSIEGKSDGTMLNAPYCKALGVTIEGERNVTTLDLGKYNIDIVEANNKVYFPMATINDLFCSSYNAVRYVNGSLYFVNMMNEISHSYVDMSSIYENVERSQEMTDYTYNELCFVADTFYGYPLKAKIAKLVKEVGFDKALDEYGEDTRMAKQLLQSTSFADFFIGLCNLNDAFDDGGHTNLHYSITPLLQYYPDSDIVQEIKNRSQSGDVFAKNVVTAIQSSNNRVISMQALNDLRKNEYSHYELIKTWKGPADACYYRNGDTGVFVFDSFQNDAVDAFKWTLDHAEENGIKKIVIDLSCNSGGSTAVVMYMMGIMTNAKDHSNIEALRYINTITGKYNSISYSVDLNLDGNIDELDKEVVYDFDYSIITSDFSFSSGNILPILAQDSGIPVFGQTSGGGSCMLSIFKTPEENIYTFSGFNKFINAKGEDADVGAPVNYDLTKIKTNDDGTEVIDYTGFYDIEAISQMMDEFYGKNTEPSKEESSKDEVSTEDSSEDEVSTEDSSEDEVSTEDSSEDETSADNTPREEASTDRSVVTPGVENFKTGSDNAAWIIVLVSILSAGTVIVLSRKKETD